MPLLPSRVFAKPSSFTHAWISCQQSCGFKRSVPVVFSVQWSLLPACEWASLVVLSLSWRHSPVRVESFLFQACSAANELSRRSWITSIWKPCSLAALSSQSSRRLLRRDWKRSSKFYFLFNFQKGVDCSPNSKLIDAGNIFSQTLPVIVLGFCGIFDFNEVLLFPLVLGSYWLTPWVPFPKKTVWKNSPRPRLSAC